MPGDPDTAPGDPESVARVLCLRQLDSRARTRAELAAYLARKGVPEEPATRVLDRFAAVGLIDDAALAQGFVSTRHHEQGLSRRALAVKLRQRGVDDATATAAIDTIDQDSEHVMARRLVERKVRSLTGLDPMVQTRRLVGMLGRKGYSPGLAYQVVRDVLAAHGQPLVEADAADLVDLED